MLISVSIVAQDEADRLADCLQSVSFADEVLLVDSGSRDDTVSIAESFGCRVISQPWLGYARQKQYAVDHCRNDWVLIIDADERVPVETAGALAEVSNFTEKEYAGYSFLRKNFLHGRWIRHCGWWPNRVVRLVDRRLGRFSNDSVHERWLSDGTVKALDFHIEHHSFRNYADMIHKMQTYSTLAAQDMLRSGEHAWWWSPLSHGLWMFIRTYFLELGVLEGFDGFMISLLNAEGSFMKYAKLREAMIYRQAS